MVASSSSSLMRYLLETTPGTVESGNPQIYRVTGGTLSQATTSSEDTELRADRGRGDSTLVSGSVAGALDISWSHKTHDDFLEALLANDYDEVGTDGILVVADMVFTGSSEITSATTALPDLEKGQWFSITGANTAANNGIYKCSESVEPTTASITVDTVIKDTTVDTSFSTTISSARLTQGNDTLKSFTIERSLEDVSQVFSWAGSYVSSLSLNYSITEKLMGSFGFMAKESEVQDTSSIFAGLSGDGIAATTTPFFNSVTGTSVLLDNASMGDSCVESLSVDIQANTREIFCLGGGLSATSISADQFKISATANIYFGSSESAALYQKKIDDAALTFSVCLTDSAGNGVAVTFPRAKITSAEVDGGSLNSDVVLALSFDAVSDPTTGTMVIFDRLGSVA